MMQTSKNRPTQNIPLFLLNKSDVLLGFVSLIWYSKYVPLLLVFFQMEEDMFYYLF